MERKVTEKSQERKNAGDNFEMEKDDKGENAVASKTGQDWNKQKKAMEANSSFRRTVSHLSFAKPTASSKLKDMNDFSLRK